jgi:DNA-binding NtrC family response regulator
MGDTLTLAGSRPARFGPPSASALELAGRSAVTNRVQDVVRRVAALEGGVLIVAHRGSDVESVAREIHLSGRRASAPFVRVPCGSADAERMLFGDPDDGSPQDLETVSADSQIAAACGGSLFLEDITELRAGAQARLARVARDGEVRIGGTPVATACRLLASAPHSIDADVKEQHFRRDLYRRLTSWRIELPPLADRPEDVPALAVRLLDDLSATRGGPPRTFTRSALALLGAMAWPGNLAELRESVERALDSTADSVIQVEDMLPTLQLDRAPLAFVPAGSLREARLRFEHDYIAAVLQHHGWRMAEAATTLGIQRPNLYRKVRQLGIPIARTAESHHE